MRADGIQILGLLLVTVAIASVVTGYGGGYPADVMGHTSEELKFTVVTQTNTCTSASSATCLVSCPAPAANEEYVVLSGSCQSASGMAWRVFGSTSPTSWTCRDTSHVAGQAFVATVYCLKGGTP